MATPARDLVFISYAREDATWLERLQKFLKPYVRQGRLEIWADPYIKVGERWERKIARALERASVGVLLVSQDLLASDFVMDEELPAMRAAEEDGLLTLFCVPISVSTHEAAGLAEFQWGRSPDEPLDELEPSKRNRALVEITKLLVAASQERLTTVEALESALPARRGPVEPLETERTGPSGRLLGVPELPPHYLPRRDDLDRLKNALLHGTDSVVGITAASKLGLHGQGGIGKSVLAAALARDDDVRRTFPDGVHWVTLGQEPDLTRVQAELLRTLGGVPVAVTSVDYGRRVLGDLMSERASLVIVDDAWDTRHARAFDAAGARSRLVVTTRDAAILTAIGAREESIERLPEEPALELLARWAGQDPSRLPDDARGVARECGYVPLALSVAGARVRDGLAWVDLLAALRRGRLEFLDHPYASVFGSMRLGVDALPADERRRYLELAVFPEDVRVPESIVAKLWRRTGGLGSTESKALLARFGRRALLERSGVAPRVEISFHDLQHDFIRILADDLPGLHRGLLDGLAEDLPRTASGLPAWHALPEDETYPWVHLSGHLAAAGLIDELREVLLDYRWLRAKLRVAGVSSLLSDLEAVPGDEDLAILAAAIRLAGHVLVGRPDQFPSQLTGRLLSVARPRIHRLLDQILASERHVWLRPLSGSLQDSSSGLVRTLDGHDGGIRALAVTSDGKHIVSGAYDMRLKVWELESGRQVHSLVGTLPISVGAITPNGRRAVTGSNDGEISVWEIEGRREVCTLYGHVDSVTAVAVTPDGRHAVIGSHDGMISVWELEGGKKVRVLEGHAGSVNAAVITPDARHIISGGDDKTMKVWDLESGRLLRDLETGGRSVLAVAVTPDGRYVVSGAESGTLTVCELETGREVRILDGHTDWVRSVAITAGGRLAISGSDDRTIRVWDVESGHVVGIFEGHAEWIMAVAATPDGRRAVSGSLGGILKVWNLEGGLETPRVGVHVGRVAAVAIAPGSRSVLSGAEGGTLKVWDLVTCREVRILEAQPASVTTLAISGDGKLGVTGSADTTLKVLDLESGSVVHTLTGHTDWVRAVSLTPKGRHVLSGSDDGTLKLWDLKSGQVLRDFVGHDDWVTAVAVTPNGRYAVSASKDGVVITWDLNDGRVVRRLTEHSRWIKSLAVTPDGRHVVSGAGDWTLQIRELESGRTVRILEGHLAGVEAVAITPDGRHVISGSKDNTLRVWEMWTGKAVASFTADAVVGSCAVAPDGVTIVAGDGIGYVHFLRLEAADPDGGK